MITGVLRLSFPLHHIISGCAFVTIALIFDFTTLFCNVTYIHVRHCDEYCDINITTLRRSSLLTRNDHSVMISTPSILSTRICWNSYQEHFDSVSTVWVWLVQGNLNKSSVKAQACNVEWVLNLLFVYCQYYLDRSQKTRSWRFGRSRAFSGPLCSRLRDLMRILNVNKLMMRFCRVYTMIRRIHTTNSCR